MVARGPKTQGAQFSEKKPPDFLKFIGPVTPLCVLYPSEIMHMVFAESLLAGAVFTRSIRVTGMQPGAPKSGSTTFRKKKRPDFLKFIGPVTTLGVL